MKKVLKFVKGKKDDKKEFERDPFSFEIPIAAQQEAADEDHVTVVDSGYGYKLDSTGKDKSINKLHKAAWQGNLDKLKVNLKKIDIDSADRYNRTPLHLAASQGHVSVVWFLLGNRANTNICDNEGKTPFLKAVECGQKEAVNILLESGADINTVDYGGNSALHIAARQGYYEIASMLLKRGANFEDSNNTGEFPLHIATQSEHRDLVELLLRYGASVNVVDRDNRSPLMFAAKSGNMPLVELFLEYGAQSTVMDSNDYTAEDYAMLGGHHDIASELKSPSEAMILPFHTGSPKLNKLIPQSAKESNIVQSDPHDEETNVSEKKSEAADNSEEWNDSVISDPSDNKEKKSDQKLSKFIPQSSEEDMSEESVQSPRVCDGKEEDTQDSPRSCVIPPPCKPPRSWDLIQSGVIDDPSAGSEPRRRSLLTLGSLRSKRESYTDTSGTGSPVPLSDSSHIGQGDTSQWGTTKYGQQKTSVTDEELVNKSFDSPSTKYEDIQIKKPAPEGAVGPEMHTGPQQKNTWDDQSSSDSDFNSDDSLPLDHFEEEEKMMGINIKSTEKEVHIKDEIVIDYSNAPTLEKKNRFLPRGSSVDLTDDSYDSRKDKTQLSKTSEKISEHKDSLLKPEENQGTTADSGTLGREGTMLGYEEVWEPIVQVHAQTSVTIVPPQVNKLDMQNVQSKCAKPASTTARSKSLENKEKSVSEIVGSRLAVQEDDNLLYPSPRLGQKVESVETNEINKKIFDGNNKYESRSLDALDDSVRNPNSWMETKVIRPKRHSRQQSVSVLSWTQSEKVQPKLPDPVEMNRTIIDSKRIKEQLECYDEALRELAQVTIVKKHGSSSLPPTRGNSEAQLSIDKGSMSLPVGHEVPHSMIVKKQGSLSLPRTNESANLIRASSLGTPNPPFFTNENLGRELAHAAIVKKQGSLSLPRTSEIPDLQKMQSASYNKDEYLSLPRSNELIDEAFKEIGQSSITTNKRGSRSLPRSITPKAMEMEADPVPPPKSKRFLRNRRRAESESEAVSRRSKEPSTKSHSFDFKTQVPKSVTNPVLATAENKIVQKVNKTLVSEGSETSSVSKESEASTLSKDSSIEKPIKKKRKMLLAMRGLIAPSLKALSDHHAKSKETSDESFDEPPFWLSRDKDGLGRQCTVVEKVSVSVKQADSPRVLEQPKVVQEIMSFENLIRHEDHVNRRLPQSVSVNGNQSKFPLPLEQLLSIPLDSLEVDHHVPAVTLPADSHSDAESVVSFNDMTPQHDYILKNHHALLTSHLRAATVEKGRLEETAAELGEKAEKLKYELADAREATRSRDDVISLLENQLTSLEDKYTLCLDELQRYKLNIGNLDQEVQHLKEICRRDGEDKIHLNEIIKLKEEENFNLEKLLAAKLEGKSGTEVSEKDQIEFHIHLKYLEEEKSRLNSELTKLQSRLDSVQKKLETTMEKNQSLIEEKAELTSKMSSEIISLHEESIKWKHMYESSQEKLNSQLGSNLVHQNMESQKTFEDQEEAQAYKKDLKDILEKVEKLKEKDSAVWQTKIKEEVNNAVVLLRTEYDKVENTISRHNAVLEKLVLKLQSDLEVSSKRQEDMASQLSQTQSELTDARQCSEELAHLREVATMVDQLRVVNSELQERLHKLEDLVTVRDAELKEKTEMLSKLEQLNQEQCEALDELENLKKDNKKLRMTIDTYNKKHFKSVSLQTESFMLSEKISSNKVRETEGTCEDESVLEKLQNENMELRDLLAIKNDQLSKMVEKTNSLVKHNERIKHQLLELKEKQNISKIDKATMPDFVNCNQVVRSQQFDIDVNNTKLVTGFVENVTTERLTDISNLTKQLQIIRAILQTQEQELMMTKTCNWIRTGSYESSEVSKLIDRLRKENVALSETVNNMLSIQSEGNLGISIDESHLSATDNKQQIEKYSNVQEPSVNVPPVTIYMSVGLPPSSQDTKHSVHIKNDDNNKVGINCCMYVDSKSNVISVDAPESSIDVHVPQQILSSQESANIRRNEDIQNSDNIIDSYANFEAKNVCVSSNNSVHFRENHRTVNIKEPSSPLDSSGEEFSNVMEIQATVHHDADAKEGLCDVKNSVEISSSSSSSDVEIEKKLQKLKMRPHIARDAATNTLPSSQNYELQKELILEREKAKKYQQNLRKLKSEVQLLKSQSVTEDVNKSVKSEANLNAKQNNSSSLVGGLLSPGRYDHNVAQFHKQVVELERKLKDENCKRFDLEMQVNKMRSDLQDKVHLEKELWKLRGQLEKDYVSRYELEHLRRNYELAVNQARKEAHLLARDDINSKISQINSFIEKQVQEQSRRDQLRNTTEAQMRQEFHDTRAKLLSELARVQAMLEMNGEEEKELREKCEKLVRDCDKTQDLHRKKLIEKSYSVNLTPCSKSKEIHLKEMKSPVHRPISAQNVISPLPTATINMATPVSSTLTSEKSLGHILRRELEKSIRKHTADTLLDEPPPSISSPTTDEQLEILRRKYFLH